jgi:hypothetical protein
MAGAGKKTFTAGEVLTASDVNTYLMEQSVMVFGGTAARSSAIPTPSEGMTTYRTDTQQIESYDGANWIGMSGLQLIKKQTIGSGVSSVTVTSAFSATYENYKILVSGGVASTGNYSLTTLGSTATGYSQKSWYGSYSDNTVAGAGYSASTSWVGQLKGSTSALNCNIDLIGPFLSKPTGIDYQTKQYAGGGIVESGSGFLNDTTSYTAITFTTNTGTWTGGTIYVYGYGV